MKRFEKVSEPIELDFYSIELDSDGNKQINIFGYTAYGEYWEHNEMGGLIVQLDQFIENVHDDEYYVSTLIGESKQYINDADEEEIVDVINSYFDGSPADYELPYEEITMDTPCGNYVNII